MGLCRDCRFWEWEPSHDPFVPSQMMCEAIPGVGYSGDVELLADPTYAYCDDSFGNGVMLVTGPDFGCVKFEAKTDD